jgi:prevent-host-death family protein
LIENAVLGSYFTLVHTVELDTLKDKLDEYVRLAAAGETVVITDHGRAVAEIVPPRSKPESIIERGVREGWITPAIRGPDWPPPRNPIKGYTLEQLLADLDEDREDRW